jgi:hypothetical protein
MKRDLKSISLFLSLLLTLVFTAYGQETTGKIQGTVKDQNGAVIPNATVTVVGPQRTFTATTNDGGEYTFSNLPPGVYNVDASATGFGPLRREAVTVELGRTMQVNFDMKAGAVGAVVEVIADEPLVDVTSTQTVTNITQQKIELLPKGLRFSSVIEVAPGVRPEPKSNGFQIDGATGSENVWVVDGLEVTRTFGGSLGSTKNIPLDFVQAVQVKTAGYEAEFGGALGGVIGVASRSGGNEYHGEVRVEVEDSDWNSSDRILRRWNLQQLAAGRRVADWYKNPDGKDDASLWSPRGVLGGPIVKNRLWFYAGYAPEYITTLRTVRLISRITPTTVTPTVLDSKTVRSRTKNENQFARIDYSPFSKLSVYASVFNTPTKTLGAFPAGTLTQGGSYEFQASAAGVAPAAYLDPRAPYRGGYTPANAVAGQATYTPLSNLAIAVKMGRNYLNDKGGNYDVDLSSPIWTVSQACNPAVFPCTAQSQTPGQIGGPADNTGTTRDITIRNYFSADATWVKRLFGQQHTLKGGWQRNSVSNDVFAGSGGNVNFFFGAVTPQTGQTGTYGYYTVSQTGQIGMAASQNDAIFVQDTWQVHPRVTLNLGIRTERETVPSFGFGALPPAIVFGWGDKFAPRLGAAWDVFGTGKLKIYGSYSVFYDTMKYDLPRGSFGGETQIVDYRALDTFDLLSINQMNQPGALFAHEDQRTVSTEPYVLGNRIFPGIDPDLKPTKEHAYTFGADYAWAKDIVFSGRFTRKVLDRTIDDVGIPTENFENYCICNPGFGASLGTSDFGFPPTPKAVREYTGVEFSVDKRFSNNWYVNASYLWSRLYGNYSGLASSDESGRGNPNVNRFFDVPWINDTSLGKLNNGLLATDRPNTLKVFAGYDFDFHLFGKKMDTRIGASQLVYQGTPLSSTVQIQLVGNDELGNPCGSCSHGVSMLINGRGDLGRTDVYTNTDAFLNYRFYLSERVAFTFNVNVNNLWNEANETDRSVALINATTPAIANEYNTPRNTLKYGSAAVTLSQAYNLMLANIANYRTEFASILNGPDKNDFYNKPILFQQRRSFRLAFGIQF